MKRVLPLVIVLVLIAAALVLRLPNMDARPMHTDEAVQAARVGTLLQEGAFHYDPTEYHGPTLPYFTALSAMLRGQETMSELDETTLRLVPLVFSLALIAMTFALWRDLGPRATLAAAVFVTISPIMVFYSTYFIHEYLLVTFTFALILSGWWYWRRPSLSAALAFGLALGFMHATKSTTAIIGAAMVVTVVCTWAVRRLVRRRAGAPVQSMGKSNEVADDAQNGFRRRLRWLHIALAVGGFALVSVLLYSAFFTHPRGIIDSVLAYLNYIGRGVGETGDAQIHVYPWWMHIKRLLWIDHRPYGAIWSEGLIVLLAVVGLGRAIVQQRGVAAKAEVDDRRASPNDDAAPLQLFLCLYGFVLLVIYSAVPYKTPWLMLGVEHAFCLAAGIGFGGLVQLFSQGGVRRVAGAAIALVLLVATLHLAEEGYRSGRWFVKARPAPPPTWAKLTPPGTLYVRKYDQRENPWVYAHTATDIFKLEKRLHELAAAAPQGYDTFLRVYAEHAWPLPWYLRQFTQVGYWPSPADTPESVDAPIIIAEGRYVEAVEKRQRNDYVPSVYAQRPGGVFVVLYVQEDLWDRMMQAKAAP